MFGKVSHAAAVLAAMMLVAMCSGCSISTEGAMYNIGIKAMKQDPAFAPGAANVTAAPRSKCTFYIGKSAASIEIPYSVSGAGSSEGVYVVWLNRVGTVWELAGGKVVPKRKQP